MTIAVPVKPHVRHFLSHTVGNPYKISVRDDLGIFILTLFKRPFVRNDYEEHLSAYVEKFSVVLSDHQVFHYGCRELDAKGIILLNKRVDNLINQLFLAVVEAQVAAGVKYNDAIRYFMNKYDYFDMNELNFEMLKKRYYRYRMKKKKQKISNKSCYGLSLNFN